MSTTDEAVPMGLSKTQKLFGALPDGEVYEQLKVDGDLLSTGDRIAVLEVEEGDEWIDVGEIIGIVDVDRPYEDNPPTVEFFVSQDLSVERVPYEVETSDTIEQICIEDTNIGNELDGYIELFDLSLYEQSMRVKYT